MTKARDIASAAPAPSTVSATEIGYLDGVSSAIQTQIDGKSGTSHNHDSTYVAKSLVDAKGDLLVGSANDTVSRLAVASTAGYVLTVDSAEATGLKWGAAPSGLTLITRQTITNSSGTNIDSIFTSSYRTYLIVIEKMNNSGGTGQEDVYLQLRYGTTTQGGNYKYQEVDFSSSYTATERNGINQIILCANAGQGSTASSHFVWFSGLGNSSERANFYGNSIDLNSGIPRYYSGTVNDPQTYTGLRLTLNTGNFDATVAIYGLAKS